MRSIKKPSVAVLTLMTAVCILIGVTPKLVKRPDTYAKYDEDWWASTLSNKCLGDPKLQTKLINFDPNCLTN